MSTHPLFVWLARLQEQNIHCTLTSVRPGVVMIQVTIPGERWEVEFFADGEIEVERFRADGSIQREAALDELLRSQREAEQ